MAKTPEGVVKAAVNKVLARYPETYVFMSVPYGYGKSTLDYLICHYGEFISIETKKAGGVPTDRQDDIIEEIQIARGMNFVIAGVHQTGPLAAYLEQVKLNATSGRQSQAPACGRSVRGQHQQPVPDGEAHELPGRAAHPPAAQAD